MDVDHELMRCPLKSPGGKFIMQQLNVMIAIIIRDSVS